MPKQIIPLTESKISNAKAKGKDYKLFDGGGLYLFVTAKGAKLWHFKYRFGGKEKLISFGAYPDISLAEARTRRQDSRNKLANDIDPSEVRRAIKDTQVELENTFEAIATEWYYQKKLLTSIHGMGKVACSISIRHVIR